MFHAQCHCYTLPVHGSHKEHHQVPGKDILDPQAQKVCNLGLKSFNAIAATSYEHYSCVFNFFVSRATNTFAKSFNSKTKAFEGTQRGVTGVKFFMLRLSKIYA